MRFILILIALACMPAQAAERGNRLEGQAVALDGDTLMLDGQRIRLWGIDAPEMTVWPWGPWARGFIDDFVQAGPVSCEVVGRHNKRLVATCSRPSLDGDDPEGRVDLGRMLLAYGYAVVYRRFTADANGRLGEVATAYDQAEREAKTLKQGIWKSYPWLDTAEKR